MTPTGQALEKLPPATLPQPKNLHDAQAWVNELWYSQYDWPLLERYRKANIDAGQAKAGEHRVVFMGDSITDGWKISQWFPGKPYLNRGINGQTTPQMLVRFRADVVNLAPSVVVILAGINDIASNTGPITLEAIEENYASMADMATKNGIAVVFSSLLPIHNHGPIKITTRRPTEKVEALNRWLQQYCADHHYVYLDYFSHMLGPDGMLRTELSQDGLHPSDAGYAIMAPLAEQAIERALSSAQEAKTTASTK